MSKEVYAWPEGIISLYTGDGAASAVLAYAKSHELALTRGYFVTQSIGGVYRRHETGKVATLTVQTMFASQTAVAIFESATAVHLKLNHVNALGSAGYFLWSGSLNSIKPAGSESQPFTLSMQYECNAWSAF